MKIITRLLALALFVAALPALAQTHDWTSIGGTGRVAPAGAFKILYTGPTVGPERDTT